MFDGISLDSAREAANAMLEEIRRIEAKFSRYRPTSTLSQINARAGQPTAVDEETAQLLDYADLCFRLSEGRFDITSGVLRKLWKFQGSEQLLPKADELESVLKHVGWQRVHWKSPMLCLKPGMELDLGGLGKEYAVDCALSVGRQWGLSSVLVNLGGDLAVSGPRQDGSPWQIGCWDDLQDAENGRWELSKGAIATSGSTQRFFLHQGKRFGHILDARSGHPVEGAPVSVSVSAATCLEAGTLSTLAMLHGENAEAFLEAQSVPFRCLRS